MPNVIQGTAPSARQRLWVPYMTYRGDDRGVPARGLIRPEPAATTGRSST